LGNLDFFTFEKPGKTWEIWIFLLLKIRDFSEILLALRKIFRFGFLNLNIYLFLKHCFFDHFFLIIQNVIMSQNG